MTVVKILRYIQHVFSFRVQPVRTMTVTTIELLSRLFCLMRLTICFDRFDWTLAIGYLVSTNMASLLWTYQAEKFNTSSVILCQADLSNFWYKLLTEIIKYNEMVNSAYCFTQAFHSHDSCQEFMKKWTGKLFRIPCSCGSSLVVIIGCESFLSLNLYIIMMSLSTVFVLLHLDSQTLCL